MKLLMFEHCSLCFRVRMAARLKDIPLVEQVVEDDDSAVMVDLVGRRVIPILVRDDGTPMLESWDMVNYIDAIGTPVLTGPERPEIAKIAEQLLEVTPYLTMPRYGLLPLPEFRTRAARDHFLVRKRDAYPDMQALRARTRDYLSRLMPILDDLAANVQSPTAINGTLSRDDIRILPLLRSVAVVEGLEFPGPVDAYFATMMAQLQIPPLPTV
ncbi:glutaredoxin 2 [Rhodobacteraceae bacterium N5(2021)]|uniref:Glutaredoxin 2 n=1 Tax=Gymnodinialimonas phycosphaerae TaxID=2841589 RepID=A0A975TYS3_9RHOB|nr:glutaredoxin 2 [Gymnodinialimonas phycosphaerae]